MSTPNPQIEPETKKKRRSSGWFLIISGLGLGAWWCISLLAHTALFGVMYVAAPNKPVEPNKSDDFGMTISPNRVRDIVEEIRDVEKKEFEEKLEELAKIKEELDRVNAEKIEQYNQIMREEAENAPDVLAAAADEALSAQQEALSAQQKAEQALGKLQDANSKANAAGSEEARTAAESEASAAATAAKEAQDAAELAQRKAAAAQSKVGEQLQLLGDATEALDAHSAATEAQSNAEKLQQNAEGVVDQIGPAKRALETADQTAAKEQDSLEKLKERTAAAESALAARKETQATAQASLDQAKAEVEADKNAAAEADAAAKKAAEEAKRLAAELKAVNEALKKEQANLAKLQQESTQAEGTLKKAETAASTHQKKVDELSATPGDSLTKEQGALDKANEQWVSAEEALKSKLAALEALKQKIAELAASAETNRAQSADAAKANTEAAAEKNRLAAEARAASENVKKQEAGATKAAKDVAAAEGQVKKAEEALAKQQKKSDDAAAQAAAKEKALNDTVASTSTAQASSTSAQKQSMELQVAAKGAIAKATSNFDAKQAGDQLAEDPTVIPLEKASDGDSLADLYKKAQNAEDAVAETFRNVRAAELAALRKIPLSDALKLTEVAKSDRPELNTDIMKSDITEVKGVREQEKTINSAKDQMDSMVALAGRMKDLATATGSELTIAQIKAKSAHSDRMEQLAMEDSGMQAKDLSGAMGGGVSPEAAKMMEMQANLGVSMAAGAWALNPTNPNSLAQLAQMMQAAGAKGAGGGQMGGGLAGAGAPGVPGVEGGMIGKSGPPGIVNVPVKDYKPLHGRTVRKGMVDVERGRNPAWLYVDTWHIIGPWPNPGRKNLNTKFPPETVVDLDAVYQGGRKDEAPMPIRWDFFQMPHQVRGKERTPSISWITPRGMGDYEIYYAYTELWFDEAADLWVAIGSDDQSKVWINDQLIWKSADVHKVWVPNEGLRKVHFRKGINRVLYRLENGHHSGGFSFMVCLAEPS